MTVCESTVKIKNYLMLKIHICDDKSTNKYRETFSVEITYLWMWE